jgi:hypothetical protein
MAAIKADQLGTRGADGAMQHGDTEAIRHFVRDTLGCGCPDDVFSSIQMRPLGTADHADPGLRLLIGDRLLIYLYRATGGAALPARVAELARTGLEDRDANSLNRFRLVIHSQQENLGDQGSAAAAFHEAVGQDDRAHLHWVRSPLLPRPLIPAS